MLTAVSLKPVKRLSNAAISLNLSNWKETACHTISSRENISAAFFSCAILLALNSPPILSMRMHLFLICFAWGYYFAPKNPFTWNPATALSLFIVVSVLAAIPLSLFFEGRNTPATGYLAMLTVLLFPLLFIKHTEVIFYALIPAWFLQAAVMAWQWFAEGASRAGGIAENENAGASFLLLGAVFLLNHHRLKWLATPLLLVIPFSGSRWVVIVGILAIGLMFASKHVPWKYILVGLGIAFITLFAAQHSQLLEAYRVGSNWEETARINGQHATERLTPSTPLLTPMILIPQGFIDSHLHNVPLRMSVESGLLSGLAWIGVGALGLCKRPRYHWAWWPMASVCLLSLMYYHTWIGPLGAFWWLLTGELTWKPIKQAEAPLRRSEGLADAVGPSPCKSSDLE